MNTANSHRPSRHPWVWALSLIAIIGVATIVFINHIPESYKIGSYLLGSLGICVALVPVFFDKVQNKHLAFVFGMWLLVGFFFLLSGFGYGTMKQERDNALISAAAYRDTLRRDIDIPYKGGQPSLLHQFLLGQPRVHRVRILGINALAVLHRHRADLQRIISEGGYVDLLLLKGKLAGLEGKIKDAEACEAFQSRVNGEEGKSGRIANRIQSELDASIAILRDIVHQLLKNGNLEDIQNKLRIRFHNENPEMSHLFVERDEDEETGDGSTITVRKKYLLLNRYSDKTKLPGQASLSLLVNDTWIEYGDSTDYFDDLWDHCETTDYRLEWLKREKVNTGKGGGGSQQATEESLHTIYDRAKEYHKRRRLDDASRLYWEVLTRELSRRDVLTDPPRPIELEDEQRELVLRFLPRVYVTRHERFKLKDLVVVVHPDPDKRLIGYHLVWEDDIDYLNDNDAGDHEIVWVEYDPDKIKVAKAWAYWHGKIVPARSEAVEDANANDSRIRVMVQWGKHGSLLVGWDQVIHIGLGPNEKYKGGYETLQFGRLRDRTRYTRGTESRRAEGPYVKDIPEKFKGTRLEFTQFEKEVDLKKMLEEGKLRELIVVSEFADAVIDQWCLAYNIHPKRDWPPRDGR